MQPQLTREDEEKIKDAIIRELVNRPPTIGLVGVSGVGKSSTINAMFKTDLPVSHVVACTKEFRHVDLRLEVTSGQVVGQEALLRVVDAPGLGEDLPRDPGYLEMYREHLPRCDVILWVLTARNRAVALDQMYLRQLLDFGDKMVFGINQVDLVEPVNWNEKLNLPSREQGENIEIIGKDRREKIEQVLGKKVRIVPYSAKFGYNLQELFTAVVKSCPQSRAWIFSAIKGFHPEDFIPYAVRGRVLRMLDEWEKRGR